MNINFNNFDFNENNEFKLSPENIRNLFLNLKLICEEFNNLKNKYQSVFDECNEKLDDQSLGYKAINYTKKSLDNIALIDTNDLNYFSKNILDGNSFNIYIDKNRELKNQYDWLFSTMNIFNFWLKEGLEGEKIDNINSFKLKAYSFLDSSYELQEEPWNVKSTNFTYKDINYSTFNITSSLLQKDYYNLGTWEPNDILDFQKGDRDLGLIIYDQANIYYLLSLLEQDLEGIKTSLLTSAINRSEDLSTLNISSNDFPILNSSNPAIILLKKEYWIKSIKPNIKITYNGASNIKGTLKMSLIKDEIILKDDIEFTDVSSETTHHFSDSIELSDSLYINKIKLEIDRNSSIVEENSKIDIEYYPLKIESFD